MEVGLYGKLPTHGDFLRRRVADDFVDAWDPWLQHCIAESRTALGELWLETYLTSPVWRFALGPGTCGAGAVAGVVVPSVDRVGRYFPLTLVWSIPEGFSTLEAAIRCEPGFERAERLLLDTLALEHFDFADFDRRVMELSPYVEPDPGALHLQRAWASATASTPGRLRCIPLSAASALAAPALQLFGCQLDAGAAPVGFWWTDGSSCVEPSWLTTRGLPDPSSYSAMLDGRWAEAGWDVAATEVDPTATLVRGTSRSSADDIRLVSAALSDCGPVRAVNQDAFLERADRGLWVVADGMGGLSDGEVASRMVCDALADGWEVATLDERIEVVIARLQEVNGYLRRAATRPVNPVDSGSTVVVLLICQREWGVLWAGDSRAYRLRDGSVAQLTTDHSWAAPGAEDGHDGKRSAAGAKDDGDLGDGELRDGDPRDGDLRDGDLRDGDLRDGEFGADNDPGGASAITRAIGVEDELMLDVVRGEVRSGDRYFLCTDGIGRVLQPADLGRILLSAEPAACCAELIAKSIAQGGSDNMTAVVIDCAAPAPEPALLDLASFGL